MLALALALAGPALAQGYSIDPEFVLPVFGHHALPGVATASIERPGSFRYGTLIQYERDPMTLWDPNERVERGAVVTNRGVAAVGASVDVTSWLAVDLALPTGWSWGTELPELAGDGFGLGDLGGTVRVLAPQLGIVRAGVRIGATLPSGRQLSYLGEESPRGLFGLMAMAERGRVRVLADAGLVVREDTPTGAGFTQGEELTAAVGARVLLPKTERVAATATLFGRAGFPALFTGGAENATEGLLGVELLPTTGMEVDIGVGRGITEGYGTTDLRLLGQLTMRPQRREPPEPEVVEVEVERVVYVPVPAPQPVVEPEPENPWDEGQLARIEEDQIRIRDRLEFIVDTPILLEKSRPILEAVAEIILADRRIGHLVIVGHASVEGSYDHNYRLSESRAQTIWEELIKYGVHPMRISYRGMGEVVTLVAGEDEASLQSNRRVEFRIVHQHARDDVPEYETTIRLPWNGEESPVIQRPVPEGDVLLLERDPDEPLSAPDDDEAPE